MTTFVTLVLIGCSALLFLPVATLFLEVIASLFVKKGSTPDTSERELQRYSASCPPFAVLIPAHNEEKMIAATVHPLLSQVRDRDRILIVADNCSDGTADIARALGAEVIERSDSERRGKGYALEFGLDHLAKGDPPAAIVFVDADCRISEGGLLKLAALACDRNGPIQGRNLSLAEGDPKGARGLGARFSEFAVRLKNYVRPLGCLQLGIPCPMTGTGMAVPWGRLQSINLGSATLAEDLVLGIDLALSGEAATYCPDVVITSALPSSDAGQLKQRTRWEQGYLLAIRQGVPKILSHAMQKRSGSLLGLALDLAILPLSLLVALQVALTLPAFAWFLVSGHAGALVLQALSLSLFTLTIGTVWLLHGRDLLSLSDLFYAPVYMVRKVPIYIGIVSGRTIGWVRADRN